MTRLPSKRPVSLPDVEQAAHELWIELKASGSHLTEYEVENEGKRARWSEIRTKPVPVFKYEPPAGTAYIREIILDVVILAGVTLLFFMLSYMTFLRYDVR